jgi:hypothetical protein
MRADLTRILTIVDELRASLVELAEADEPPPDPPSTKAKWAGPVPEGIRREREERHIWHWWLSRALGRDATMRTFAARNNLSESECSRHLTSKLRCIAPGSIQDISILRALERENRRMEAELAKRHGTAEIIPKLRQLMFADNAQHDGNCGRTPRHRANLPEEVSGKSRRTADT